MKWILHTHFFFLSLSILIFLLRGVLMIANQPAANSRTAIAGASAAFLLLLASGVGLAYTTGHGVDGFTITKFIGLMVYVVLGLIALKPGLSKPVAIVLWLLGLGAFVTTYLVAKGMLPVLF